MAAKKTTQRYAVDWSDPVHPHIVKAEHTAYPEDGVTLTAAKEQIIDRFTSHIEHARDVIRSTRALKADEIED